MRRLTLSAIAILASAGALASCATTNEPEPRSAAAQKELSRWLDGKVAGQAQACLPTYRSQDMVVIDENTLLFRDGSNRVWRTELRGPCNGLGRPGTALVTKTYGGTGMCRGEIAQVVDTAQGFTVGSCGIGDFVPYTGPRGR